MAEQGQEDPKPDKKERRRRLRGALARVRQHADQVCGTIGQADGLLDRVSSAIEDIRDFAEATEVQQLVPRRVRRGLDQAVARLDQAKERTGELADACDKVQKALGKFDRALAGGFPVVMAISMAATALAGVVIGLVLSIGVAIDVENES